MWGGHVDASGEKPRMNIEESSTVISIRATYLIGIPEKSGMADLCNRELCMVFREWK